MPANSTRSTKKKMELAARRLRVAQMYLDGKTQTEIAAAENVSQSVISEDLKWLCAEWLKSSLEKVDQAKQNELLRINELEREAQEAWERSIGQRVKTRTVKKPGFDKEGNPVELAEKTVERERLVGDPRFLTQIAWCIEQRCKILGAYAPTKGEFDLTSGGEPILIRLDK